MNLYCHPVPATSRNILHTSTVAFEIHPFLIERHKAFASLLISLSYTAFPSSIENIVNDNIRVLLLIGKDSGKYDFKITGASRRNNTDLEVDFLTMVFYQKGTKPFPFGLSSFSFISPFYGQSSTLLSNAWRRYMFSSVR